jgi:hypothetical protein
MIACVNIASKQLGYSGISSQLKEVSRLLHELVVRGYVSTEEEQDNE